MICSPLFHCLLLSQLVCCTSHLRYSSLFLGNVGNGFHDNNTRAEATVDAIRSIKILGKVKKEISPEILVAMKQCESAILKPKNDEMLKGPSFCLGLLKQSVGDLHGALAEYERAILRFPLNGAASFNAGSILENLGRDNEAVLKYKTAMLVNETCESSLSKLIPLLLRNGRENEAKLICQEICNSGPLTARYKAYEHLGSTFYKMGLLNDSFIAYENAVNDCRNPIYSSDTGDNRLVEALNNAAQAASASPSTDIRKLAEGFFQRSLEVMPSNADTHTFYGVFLKYENRISQAISELQTALSLDPTEKCKETGYATVQLASINGGSAVTKMNENYISGLFDGYADRFDSELCGKLEYMGHHQVVQALLEAFCSTEKKNENVFSSALALIKNNQYSIIDIGSGTGLCGELLRKTLPDSILSGVDLSQRMLEKSIERGCYNSLALGDAALYLDGTVPSSIDGIIAADVFIYVGELRRVFESSFQALKAVGGYLIFTVEELQKEVKDIALLPIGFTADLAGDGGSSQSECDETLHKGVRLLTCGRFGHSEEYVRGAANSAGFEVVSSKRDIVRYQSGVPVRSITFVLTKVT